MSRKTNKAAPQPHQAVAIQRAPAAQMPSPKKLGRPPLDPEKPAPTISIQEGTRRYRKGWDALHNGVKEGVIPGIELNGRLYIITAKADRLFGLVLAD
jgi:hypothetical protein